MTGTVPQWILDARIAKAKRKKREAQVNTITRGITDPKLKRIAAKSLRRSLKQIHDKKQHGRQ